MEDIKIPFVISLGVHLLLLLILPFIIIYQQSSITYKITEVEFINTSLKPAYLVKVKVEQLKEKKKPIEEQPYWEEPQEISRETVLTKVIPVLKEEEMIVIKKKISRRKEYEKKEFPSHLKIEIEEKERSKEKLGSSIGSYPDVLDISGQIAEAKRKILKFYYPTYPEEVQIEVKIELKFWVLPDGTVSRIIPLKRGEGRLEILAIAAMKKWLFEPLPKYAKQETQWGIIPLLFKLE